MKKQARKPVRKGTWAYLNGAKAAKMFKAGKSVPDIAEKFGDRSKQNRVRAALFAAGVYKYQTK
jgi:hypothetical protein